MKGGGGIGRNSSVHNSNYPSTTKLFFGRPKGRGSEKF
ncbi:hypothetical protein CCACVL1_16712 [Corchorus capsularis]|uniref:Uncharacterized protein n=1 Tax=Corchorus capsularis TaxID=210143 RepID=A0A1R3HVR7_COCAP|nr:hypothetical protein CCACVL1_16712 [Corchorus capsularis]